MFDSCVDQLCEVGCPVGSLPFLLKLLFFIFIDCKKSGSVPVKMGFHEFLPYLLDFIKGLNI